MRVGIVAQKGNARAAYLAEEIRTELPDDVEVAVDEATAASLDIDGVPTEQLSDADLVVSIGGDGTFLYAVAAVGETPIVGVNLGEVGFLNAIPPNEAVEAIRGEVELYRERGMVPHRELPRLRAEGDDWTVGPAANEIVVQGPQRGRGQGVGLEVRVDGSLYASSRADGLLTATPTGSTAYNLSEGGPLVHPLVGGLIVTEMCASDPTGPLVIDEESEVTVRVEDAPWAAVIGDGRNRVDLEPPELVRIRLADERVRLAGPPVNFFEALEKLE